MLLTFLLMAKLNGITAAWAMSRMLKFRGLCPSAPALDKVCLACWPRAQGWPCAPDSYRDWPVEPARD